MWLSRAVKSCMDIILPPCCPVCGVKTGVGNSLFCRRCRAAIRYLRPPFCRICGSEATGAVGIDHQPLCGQCLHCLPPYAIARSVIHYEAEVKQLVHKLKYGGRLSIVPALNELIGTYTMTDFADIEWVLVVPLHIRRLRHRGFNQAAVLARLFFADRLEIIQPHWLQRTRNTVPQTELDGVARRANLHGAFQLLGTADVIGRRVCLVDDVFTTGTTVTECCREILAGGAAAVSVLTLARVGMPHRMREL